ncbi:MAG: RdgB/HAM1 family non-canonical purine NTP pyrophosphatase [Deltaproteobacteria bacterium]|jgi:XTP/dITP diphosphohydrolase|nr:RdgB/HAM1 family non-canonical purine NTP pyrophosphatase [Deltaproteobacteria bacterium]
MEAKEEKPKSPALVIASGNKGKIAEFSRILGAMGIVPVALGAALGPLGLPCAVPGPEENGATFAENAAIKAAHYSKALGMPCLADDSGLCVAALGGAPGVLSARYGGAGLDPAARNALLLEAMEGTRDRRACFKAALCLMEPKSGGTLSWEAGVAGEIAGSPRGNGGFGYDPIFWLPSRNLTMAELSPGEKDKLSHRGLALALMERDRDLVLRLLNINAGQGP